MRSAFVSILVAGILFSAGAGLCADIYFEGWEGGGTAGWESATVPSSVVAGDAGGNPGGCLILRGESGGTEPVGAVTMIVDATGDYWAKGVGLITFDMSFAEGWYSRAWLRVRSSGDENSAWTYGIRIPNEPGGSWRRATIELDDQWSDYDAQLAGWSKRPEALSFQETFANVYAVEIVFMATESVDVILDNFRLAPPPACPDELPAPVLVFKGKSATNDFKIKWDFEVENWADFSPELFLASPLLPPCGNVKAGPRSYVRFLNHRGAVLGVICGISEPEMLAEIGFVAGDIGSPDIYIEVVDRRCGLVTASNVVSTEFSNEKPVADAGADQKAECGGGLTPVTVDASGSSDPDGDDISFEWSAQGVTFDNPASAVTVGHFPMGTTHVVLKVFDGLTYSTDVVAVTVEDHTPPTLQCSLSRSIVWPPNHKYFDVHATVTADDACGEVASVTLIKLFETDPSGRIAEPAADAVRGLNTGRLDTDFQVLAERCGNEGERSYGLVYMALDRSLNLVSDTVYVCVPHDRSGHAYSSRGFKANGKAFADGAVSFVLVVPSVRLPDYELDAGALDVSSARVSNTKGAAAPVSVHRGDVDGDGLPDMVFRFSTAEVSKIRELADDKHEPVSFYCEYSRGGVHTVLDIFELGKPRSISTGELKLVYGKHVGFEKEMPEPQLSERLPAQAALGRAYPNPFNPNVSLDFTLPAPGDVRLLVYDVNGRLVRRLVVGEKRAGVHTAVWNARDDAGGRVTSGVYFVRLEYGAVTDTRKIVLLK
jgi:hypothetical protein